MDSNTAYVVIVVAGLTGLILMLVLEWLRERLERDRLRVALQLIASGEDAPDLEVEGDARSGLHCGVEDRDCRDRYEGADFGYTVGVEKTLEWARNEANAALKGEA